MPLNVQERIQLWLTHRGLKKATLITLEKNKQNQRIFKWLHDTSLEWVQKRERIFVSKNKLIANQLSNIWNKNNQESEYQKGILLGYPTKPSQAFAKYADNKYRGKYLVNIIDPNFPKSVIPYYPYIFFIVRKGKEKVDSVIAKRWAKVIRADIPKLAKWYEKEIKSAISKQLS